MADDRYFNYVTAVSSAGIIDDIDVTVVQDANGWRFHAWHRQNGLTAPAMIPSSADCKQSFATADDAAAYFRQTYMDELRGR